MKTLLTGAIAALLISAPAFAGGDPQAGQAKAQVCAGCHGAQGTSPSPTFPNLGGQHEDYLYHALRAYKSGARKNAIMEGQVAGLSDEDMKNLAAWFASQPGPLRDVHPK